MTQIDSTAQTDLGISDHEELLLPYKAIYSQLLDTIKEVVAQTLDNAYGTNAPHITTEVLELALKDNLSSLVNSPEKSPVRTPQPERPAPVTPTIQDPKLLKMLQQSGLQQPDIFNQTTNQLLRLIELNSLNSDLHKQKSYSPFLSSYPSLPLHKVNPYTNLLAQHPALFQNKPRDSSPTIPYQPKQSLHQHAPSPLMPTLQKPYNLTPETVGPKIFSPGVIKSEDISKISPSRSPLQAFSTPDTKSIFSPSSPFTTISSSKPVTTAPTPLHSSLITTNPLHSSLNSTPLSLHNSLNSTPLSLQSVMNSTPLSLQSVMNSTPLSLQNALSAQSILSAQSALSAQTALSSQNAQKPGLNTGPLLHSTFSTAPFTNAAMSNMEVHQNFIKQINLLNQAAPSMVGQKLARIPGQDKTTAGDIEKVLMDIQVNLSNIKPDPWNTAKDKLYKCPHCDTAFARRQYLSNHIINVHNLKTCPECKTTFSNEDAFNAHLAMHPKKEYECGSCNKSFNSVYLLKNHRKTHVKDKPFACNICGKTFADKYYLRNHFSIHSPVKPYSCPVCGRGFASSSALRYHSFQHTGEKPAKCQYCPSEFVQKNQLKLHIARKHKELINNMNGVHDGDIIPGNMSIANSPGGSPARTSPPHKTSPLDSIVHSPNGIMHFHQHALAVTTTTEPTAAPKPEVEPMQVDKPSERPAVPETKVEPAAAPRPRVEPAAPRVKVETPTVSAATEQLQELIASLQRTSKQSDTIVSNLTPENKAVYATTGTGNNFALSSPFSKITDGINQILEGSPLAVNETI